MNDLTVDIDVNIWVVPSPDTDRGYTYRVADSSFDWIAGSDNIKIGTEKVSIRIPEMSEQDLLLKAVATLKERKRETLARAEKECIALQKRINELLRLTYRGDPDNVVIEQDAV